LWMMLERHRCQTRDSGRPSDVHLSSGGAIRGPIPASLSARKVGREKGSVRESAVC
jgi:hypothetical protein